MPTLLLVEGSSGPALAAVRSLGRSGWRVLVPRGSRAALSRFAGGTVELANPEREPLRFREQLPRALAGVDVVAPTGDGAVEEVWRADLGATRVLGADATSVPLCVDKSRALAAADRHGFPTPEWYLPATEGEARDAALALGFPCVVKPKRSFVPDGETLRQRRHVCVRTLEELPAALGHGRDPDGSLPIVQAHVGGRSLSVTAVLQHGRVVAYAARETLSFFPVGGGTSVWKRTIPPDDAGVQAALELLRSVGYEGLAEVEYQVDAEGTPRLMEIGGRLHGWVPLAIAAGVDLPLIAARALMGEVLPDPPPYRVGVQMRWPGGELRRVRAALARAPQLPPATTRRTVVRQAWPPWAPGMHYDGFDLRDLRPSLPFKRARA